MLIEPIAELHRAMGLIPGEPVAGGQLRRGDLDDTVAVIRAIKERAVEQLHRSSKVI